MIHIKQYSDMWNFFHAIIKHAAASLKLFKLVCGCDSKRTYLLTLKKLHYANFVLV